jgi:hypothetical protein
MGAGISLEKVNVPSVEMVQVELSLKINLLAPVKFAT